MIKLRPMFWNRDHRSEVTDAILGLNLLYLLVENRLSDFHCEVLSLTLSQRAMMR